MTVDGHLRGARRLEGGRHPEESMNRQNLFPLGRLVAASVRLQLVPALLAILAVKVLILALDANPRFFLWDSVTYLQGAIGGPLPRDRSFLYSLLINAIAVPTRSMLALVIAQTLAGAIGALLIYLILRKFLDVRFGVALAAALLFAVEPSQLFYERMVMAEAFGSMIWLGFVALALAYMRDGRTFWLPVVALVGILAVSFRLNGTAVIVVVSSLLPLLRVWFGRNGPSVDVRKFALQLGLAIAHAGRARRYRHIVADVAHTSRVTLVPRACSCSASSRRQSSRRFFVIRAATRTC
jgi:hypothetical protein